MATESEDQMQWVTSWLVYACVYMPSCWYDEVYQKQKHKGTLEKRCDYRRSRYTSGFTPLCSWWCQLRPPGILWMPWARLVCFNLKTCVRINHLYSAPLQIRWFRNVTGSPTTSNSDISAILTSLQVRQSDMQYPGLIVYHAASDALIGTVSYYDQSSFLQRSCCTFFHI